MSLKDILVENVIWGALFLLPRFILLSVLVLLVLACVLIGHFAGICDKSKRYMKLAAKAYVDTKYAKAAKYCEAALEYNESLSDAYRILAQIAMQDKDYDGAMKILKKGLAKMKEAGISTDGLKEMLGEINLAKLIASLNVEE